MISTSKNVVGLLVLCSLVLTTPLTLAAEPDLPSKDLLFLQYGQIAAQLRNSTTQFSTREISRHSANKIDEHCLIKCCKLFTFGDEAQFRVLWSNNDRVDWRSGCDFDQLGTSASSSTDGADRTICFQSKRVTTAEIQKVSESEKVPFSVRMAVYESERPLGAFFLPYVASERQWNHGGEFLSAGRSLLDQFFSIAIDRWGDVKRDILDGENRLRVDISLSGQRVKLAVKTEYGNLEAEDILSSWFETEFPHRLKSVTRERQFYYEGVEVPIRFSGEQWWERRLDLSGYERSPESFSFPMEGRETMVTALHLYKTFDEIAAACKSTGELVLNSEHYLAADRAWHVRQIEQLDSDEGLWIEPSPGMLIHNVDAGTELLFGKTPEESAEILGHGTKSPASNTPTIPTAKRGFIRYALVVVNILLVLGLIIRYFKTRHTP